MKSDCAATRQWLELVYGNAEGCIGVTELPSARSMFFATTTLDQAATHIAHGSATGNVYVSCCTLREPPQQGRGAAIDAYVMPGLWCDLDIAGDAHKWAGADGMRLPVNGADAASIFDDLGVWPTAIIDSGHGMYGWWLFTEPLILSSPEVHAAASTLSVRWSDTLIEFGRRRGMHVDNVSDLSRILRVPGAMNHKLDPVSVRLAEFNEELRYRPADLLARCVTAPPPPRQQRTNVLSRLRGGGLDSLAGSVIDRFVDTTTWTAILEPAGFVEQRSHGDVTYWRHSAATSPRGIPSASTDARGVPVLVVFSESAAAATRLPLGPGHKLTKFRTWAKLNYGGDETAAAHALADEGAA